MGRRSLLISQTVLFASTLGILKFSNDGEALIDNLLEVSSFTLLFYIPDEEMALFDIFKGSFFVPFPDQFKNI